MGPEWLAIALQKKIQGDVFSNSIVRNEQIVPWLASIGLRVFARPSAPLYGYVAFSQDVRVLRLVGHFGFNHQNEVSGFGDEVRLILCVIVPRAIEHLELAFGGP